MQTALRLGALALAVTAIAIGSITFLPRAAGPGGVVASPSGPSSPAPDTSHWATYTSATFGFEVRYPDDFEPTAAVGPNPIYAPDSTAELDFDRVTAGAGFSGLYVASAPMPDQPMTPEQWIRRYDCPCEDDLSDFARTTIDGAPAFSRPESGGEQVLGYWVFAGDRVYRILAVNLLVRDEALRDAFLSTIRLHPDDAVDTP